MDSYNLKVIETLVVLVLYVVFFFITKNIINSSLKKTHLERTRRKIIIKVILLFISIAVALIIAGIGGLEQREIALFASTVITALGIAFFAQWSLLSNITSSIILFFNHPLKLGDTIKILDKDYPIEGEVAELTYFFIHIKTVNGDTITIPNSLALQKSILVSLNQKDKTI